MSATPTDAERELAEHLGYRLQAAVYAADRQQCRDAIAQALADQRARYEAVADELEEEARINDETVQAARPGALYRGRHTGLRDAYAHATERIRKVSEP